MSIVKSEIELEELLSRINEKKLKIVKKGDHSLSSNKNLKLIIKELNLIVQKIIN